MKKPKCIMRNEIHLSGGFSMYEIAVINYF